MGNCRVTSVSDGEQVRHLYGPLRTAVPQVHEKKICSPPPLVHSAGEFDFTIHHQPSKDQGHVDGLSRLPVEATPPESEEAALQVQAFSSKETAQQTAQELYRATHVGVTLSGNSLGTIFRSLEEKGFARK